MQFNFGHPFAPWFTLELTRAYLYVKAGKRAAYWEWPWADTGPQSGKAKLN